MATNKRQFSGQRPIALHGMQVCVADSRVLDVDEHFVGTGLLDGNLLVFDGTAGFLDHAGPLLGGDGGGGHEGLVRSRCGCSECS